MQRDEPAPRSSIRSTIARVIAGQAYAAARSSWNRPARSGCHRRSPCGGGGLLVGHGDRHAVAAAGHSQSSAPSRERRRCSSEASAPTNRAAATATTTIADGLRTTLVAADARRRSARTSIAFGTCSEAAIVARDADDVGANEDRRSSRRRRFRSRASSSARSTSPARASASSSRGGNVDLRTACRGDARAEPRDAGWIRHRDRAAARRPRRDTAIQDEGSSRHRDVSRRLSRCIAVGSLHPPRPVRLRQVDAAEGGAAATCVRSRARSS